MTGIREFAAKIRNLFSTGEFQKRYDEDGRVQVATHTGRVLEKTEAFSYGFTAKAKSGRVIVRESGDVEVLAGESGAVLVKTEKGTITVKKDGKMYLDNEQADICALFAGLIDEIKGIATSGSPASQTVNPATQQKLEAYKNKVKELFAEAE